MIKTPELKNWKYYLSNPDRKPACLVLMLHGQSKLCCRRAGRLPAFG